MIEWMRGVERTTGRVSGFCWRRKCRRRPALEGVLWPANFPSTGPGPEAGSVDRKCASRPHQAVAGDSWFTYVLGVESVRCKWMRPIQPKIRLASNVPPAIPFSMRSLCNLSHILKPSGSALSWISCYTDSNQYMLSR